MRDERTYNGTVFRKRTAEDDILQSHKPGQRPLYCQLPSQMLDLQTPESLRELMKEGAIRLASIQDAVVNERHLVEVSFEYQQSGTPFLRIYLDLQSGYMPVRAVQYSRAGDVSKELNAESLTAEASGNRYSMPIRGDIKQYSKGRLIAHHAFVVDRESVVFDAVVPNSVFEMVITDKDRLYDMDTKLLVQDPERPNSRANLRSVWKQSQSRPAPKQFLNLVLLTGWEIRR